MSDKLVILVGGLLTSGKDAFADNLVRDHGFVKLGMSDTLAKAIHIVNPWIQLDHELRITWPKKEDGSTGLFGYAGEFAKYRQLEEHLGYVGAKEYREVREWLQLVGTEVGRELLGKNIWVEAAQSRVQEQFAAGNNRVVITGARFPNELRMNFLAFDPPVVTSVWIDRPSITAAADLSHSSEGSVSAMDFEYVLINDQDLKALENASSSLLDMILDDYGFAK